MNSDPRIDLAKSMSFREVMDRLPLDGLRKDGREMVGPCPKCGGSDRFAINPDLGVFLCRGCNARGDGIDLVQHVLGCDFKAALSHLVGEAQEIDPKELARRQARARREKERRDAESERYRKRAISDAIAIWKAARPSTASPAVDYLAARAISIPSIPKALRFKPDHPYVRKIGSDLVTLHRGPCMIAAIQGPNDRLAAVHQTWIDLSSKSGKAEIVDPTSGEVFPAKMVRGSKKGGAIRLGGDRSEGVLVMGEGIETTLSARVLSPRGPAEYWAGVDLENFAGQMVRRPGVKHSGEPDLSDARAFVPPAWVRHLVLLQDGDSAPSMTRAKLKSCILRAQSVIPGLSAEIIHPGEGKDFNDLLREKLGHTGPERMT